MPCPRLGGVARSEDTRPPAGGAGSWRSGEIRHQAAPLVLFLVLAGTGAGTIGQGLGMRRSAVKQAPPGVNSHAANPTDRLVHPQ
jgi:hypothetical protein